ncbi:hypothetical protein N665_0564s0014 [Sinapis alba]|nr:hypothetical protein N665_0564s0014 [Sinapis alba]
MTVGVTGKKWNSGNGGGGDGDDEADTEVLIKLRKTALRDVVIPKLFLLHYLDFMFDCSSIFTLLHS